MRLPLVLFAFGSLALLETDDSVSFWHVAPRPGQEKQHDCSPRIWLGWVSSSLFPIETNPNPPKKVFALGRIDPNATLDLVFLGLGWPWVGEFVGFITIFTCFPTQQNLVNRKHHTLIRMNVLGFCMDNTVSKRHVAKAHKQGHPPHLQNPCDKRLGWPASQRGTLLTVVPDTEQETRTAGPG